MHVTRSDAGVPFQPAPDHHGVRPRRLHGREAGPTEHLVVTRSDFAGGAEVDSGPVAGETVYVVLSGELTIEVRDETTVLRAGDSAHLPDGTVRALRVRPEPASVLVVRAS